MNSEKLDVFEIKKWEINILSSSEKKEKEKKTMVM